MMAVRAQLLQLGKTRFVWGCFGVCAVGLALMFYQSAINTGSGIMDADAAKPATAICLFLFLTASLLAVLPAVPAGSYLGGKDDEFGTSGVLVHCGGRAGVMVAKLVSLAVFSALVVLAVTALGLLLGLVRTGGWGGQALRHTGAQIACTFVVVYMTALLAFTVAVITRGVVVANIACFAALVGQMFLPSSAARALRWINPMAYIQGLVPSQFPELAHVLGVTVPGGVESVGKGLLWGAGFLIAEITVVGLVAMKREFKE